MITKRRIGRTEAIVPGSLMENLDFARYFHVDTDQRTCETDNALAEGKSPLLRAPVFVPGCGTAAEGFACEWSSFQKTLESSIDRSAVK